MVGTLAFVVIEGLGFVFAIVVYLYLYTQNKSWPLGPQPDLLWPTLLTVLVILSEVPNVWLKRQAAAKRLNHVRAGLVVMSIIGIVAIGIRCFELTTLNLRWDSNAYGSIVWFLIGLHTTHLVTDVFETLVIATAVFVGPVDMRRFSDVDDNQGYRDFVVISWLLVYITLY